MCEEVNKANIQTKEIWLAGGCFWGVEAYFKQLEGVLKTTVGYANGNTENPGYYDIPKTGHAETVRILYEPNKISLRRILEYYFTVIDPTVLNRQGPDIGAQYRTGIYYKEISDLPVILKFLEEKQKKYSKPIVTEVKVLENFYPAEEYHQDYLKKNPGGYCHIDLSKRP